MDEALQNYQRRAELSSCQITVDMLPENGKPIIFLNRNVGDNDDEVIETCGRQKEA